MRNNRILIRIFLIAAMLTGCTAPALIMVDSPESPIASETRTPFLPENDTPMAASASNTPTSTITETATLVPTGIPTPTPSLRINLEAVGDIMLARTIANQVQAAGPEIVFAGVQSELDSADVLVGNLECALTVGGEQQNKSYTFAAPPEMAQALALAGFDVLSLANNHAMDYGGSGLLDTRNTLVGYGIASVGAGENVAEAHTPVIVERNGLRLAFLAYVDVPKEYNGFDAHTWIATVSQPGVAWANRDQIRIDVAAAKHQADVVVVLLHSGYEENTAVVSFQRAEAITAIDAGAALVIGSHPHILQAIEHYHGGLIAYSLGNFVFDDSQGIFNATVIFRAVLTPEGVQSFSFIPVLIENGLPRLAADWEAPAIGTMVSPINP
jgi:poly-gamma-glutamate capsule biosynthesis protein CapA/YwtB (metallophosphatase superfamily)